MARIYSTGPCLIYAGANDALGATPIFLGTGETAPEIDIKPEFEPIMNDLGGTRVPFDRLYEGEEGMVSVVLNRFNWSVLSRLMTRPRHATGAGTPGTNVSGEIGTIMGREAMTYTLWVNFPYTAKAAMTGDMVAGYRFFSAFLLGPEKLQNGTKDQKVHCIWQCQRSFSTANGSGSTAPNGGTFTLYDHNMTGLPAID